MSLSLLILLTGCTALTGGNKVSPDQSGEDYVIVEQAAKDMPEMLVERRDPELGGNDSPKLTIETQTSTKAARKIVQGYRIQLLTTRDRQQADSLAKVWSDELDMKVYKSYEAPFYKLRVGNFEDENDAQDLLSDLRGQGFGNAWTVPDRIFLDRD